jgi:hypothetical protein
MYQMFIEPEYPVRAIWEYKPLYMGLYSFGLNLMVLCSLKILIVNY